MKRLVEYKLKNGQSVAVEVDMPEDVRPEATGYSWPTKQEAEMGWEDALEKIKPATEAVIETVQGLGPKEYQVEFGLTFTAAAGAIIASASAEANFRVTLTWN
ncbi:MAG: CU044_2847 family protein [Halobacteriota archaeon]